MDKKAWNKAAKDYFSTVHVSPFSKGVINPLLDDIKKLNKDKKVIDLGCGTGNLIPYIKHFKEIHAVDFSPIMIEKAKSKHKKVNFKVKDLRNLEGYYNQFNLAFAINSILGPSILDSELMFKESYKVLKNNSTLIAILPSMDSEIYRATLTFHDELKRVKNENIAIKRTHKEMTSKEYDFMLGLYKHKGDKQKHFYKVELEYYLKKAGFKSIKFKKVLYPWRTWEAKKSLHKEDKLWDWLVYAKK